MRARRRWAERHPDRRRRLARPVISVGNLSMGGTGKTPVVAAIADWLIAQGERPAILSRGYARADAADGVVVVSDGTRVLATIDRAGDEPLMLARQVPGAAVCVSPDRYLAGTLAERQLGCTVHVLDDGFQHVELARDLDVLVTTVGEIPQGACHPDGPPARADRRGRARARAGGVGRHRRRGGRRGLGAWVSQGAVGAPIAITGCARRDRSGGRRTRDAALGRDSRDAPGLPRDRAGDTAAKVLVVAGIANPQRFADALGRGLADRRRDHVRRSPSLHASGRRAIAARSRERGASGCLHHRQGRRPLRSARRAAVPAVRALPLRRGVRPVLMRAASKSRSRARASGTTRRAAGVQTDRLEYSVGGRGARRSRAGCRTRGPGVGQRARACCSTRSIGRIAAWRSPTSRSAFRSGPTRERRAIARATFAHFGQVLLKLLTFSALTPDADAGARRIRRRRSACGWPTPTARACCSSPGHFGFWELQAMAHAVKLRPIGVLARALDNPPLNELLERMRTGTGNSVIYRQGAVRRVLKTAGGRRRRGAADRSAHAQPRRDLGELLPAARRRRPPRWPRIALRTGRGRDPGVRDAAAGRPLSIHLRSAGRAAGGRTRPTRFASSRSAAPTCSRCTCAGIPELWLWMHRRWRDSPVPEATGHVSEGEGRRTNRNNECACADRLVIVAPNWLGDAVMALPALADVRRQYPDAHLAVAARAAVAPLFEMVEGVDEVVTAAGARRPGARCGRGPQMPRRLRCRIVRCGPAASQFVCLGA